MAPKPKSRTNSKWTPSEDAKLLELVHTHGTKNWTLISKSLTNRKGKQCRERYRNHLDPSICHEPFTDAEDKEILRFVEEIGTRWARISELMPGRTENAVKNRYYSNLVKRADTPKPKPKPKRSRKPKAKASRFVQDDSDAEMDDEFVDSESEPEVDLPSDSEGEGEGEGEVEEEVVERAPRVVVRPPARPSKRAREDDEVLSSCAEDDDNNDHNNALNVPRSPERAPKGEARHELPRPLKKRRVLLPPAASPAPPACSFSSFLENPGSDASMQAASEVLASFAPTPLPLPLDGVSNGNGNDHQADASAHTDRILADPEGALQELRQAWRKAIEQDTELARFEEVLGLLAAPKHKDIPSTLEMEAIDTLKSLKHKAVPSSCSSGTPSALPDADHWNLFVNEQHID